MVSERPKRPGQAPNSPATSRPNPTTQRTSSQGGGRNGGNHRGGGNGSGGNLPPEGQPDETSPWLIQPELKPDPTASFVEYLRWMRSPDSEYKDLTKVQILQMAAEKADYRKRLEILNNRTQLIADAANCFEVTCPWRIRVGGHRGPESILLPAFDALGMPYIPSSTLRGVARTQAIREKLPANLDYSDKEAVKNVWKAVDRQVAEWFGHLDAEDSDRTGKVIFLDAYPIPSAQKLGGGLAVDMANSIWSWKDDALEYKPNPNPYFSLEKSTFLIGLRRLPTCSQEQFDQIKQWLIAGLNAGVGSQVNSGYGRLLTDNIQLDDSQDLLQVKFNLKGQLIHGRQEFRDLERPYKWVRDKNSYKVKADTIPEPEVRPTAFKSMLRYWFRTLSLGVLPVKDVEEKWEPVLFGAIQPQTRGWIEFQIKDSSDPDVKVQEKGKPCLEQSGLLKLSYSLAAPQLREKRTLIKQLFEHLIWLMFHLGGVGQGARRPLYCRENRRHSRLPLYRGTELKAESNDLFQEPPKALEEFCTVFHEHLQGFYQVLEQLTEQPIVLPKKTANRPTRKGQWQDVADANCEIVVCAGSGENGKPFALAVLHSDDLKIPKMKNGRKEYDPELCGKTGDRSPVWIRHLGSYQVVTVFGANQDPRKQYLETLKNQASKYQTMFPLT